MPQFNVFIKKSIYILIYILNPSNYQICKNNLRIENYSLVFNLIFLINYKFSSYTIVT